MTRPKREIPKEDAPPRKVEPKNDDDGPNSGSVGNSDDSKRGRGGSPYGR